MATVWIIPAVLQVAIPLALLVWQALSRERTALGWLLSTIIVFCYITATALSGLWLAFPSYLATAFVITSLAVSAARWPHPFRFRLPARPGARLFLTIRGVAAVLTLGVVWASLVSRQPPDGHIVDLAFPLREGTYSIANGGSNRLTNAHIRTLDPRYARYRGQSYGVDIVKGTPSEIFGDLIYAPCEGSVVRVEDWLPDLTPPAVDRAHPPGNFVLVECDDAHVLVGHMRSGSVRVHPGDYVTTDTTLGEVGNSGNSDQPHLHIHAQRPGRPWDPFIGDPLPIRLDGRYLARNNRFTKIGPLPADEID
jgi:murein DD-endopeptidase MepM/ murein hydrolase activator NlpD